MKKRVLKRALSVLMAFVMLLTMVGVMPTVAVNADTIYKHEVNADKSVTITYDDGTAHTSVDLMGTFSDWSTGVPMVNTSGTMWTYTTPVMDPGSYEYKLKLDGEWMSGDNIICDIQGDVVSEIATPVVNADKTITFYLDDVNGTYANAKAVYLMGTVPGTDWNTGIEMTKDATGGTGGCALYSVTTEVVAAGTYQYKFRVVNQDDTSSWIVDPMNKDNLVGDNSTVTVSDGDSTPTETTVEMHFNNVGEWPEVYAMLAGVSWGALEGYGYAGSWPGAEVEADAENDGWYSFTVQVAVGSELKVIFNDNSSAGGQQTGNLEYTTEGAAQEYWVTFTTHNGAADVSTTAPTGWVDCSSNAPVNPNAGSSVVSPVVNADKTITFTLEDVNGNYTTDGVNLMGNLPCTNWDPGLAMEKEGTLYTVTTPVMNPGIYEYKFKSGETWMTDPMNDQTSNGNSKVVVPGLSGSSIEVQEGVATELPVTLDSYGEDGSQNEAEVVYSLKDSTLADKVTIADGKITVVSESGLEELVLVATDADGETAEVNVSVAKQIFEYTVYFYDAIAEHMSVDAADIWAWEEGGDNIGAISFTGTEELADGNTWLKATIKTEATNLGLIPRSKGGWDWQTSNQMYNNADKAAKVTLYIVNGDTAPYTSLPGLRELRERYVMIEFNRTKGDYEGWNLYTWNSGFGSEVVVYPSEIDGKQYFIVPVKDSTQDFNLSFCVRKSTDEDAWAEKDGGDHSVAVPADQIVVKSVFNQGEGMGEALVYNSGYESNAAEGEITFLYRDDMAVIDGTLADLEDVCVVVDGKSYPMTYNAQTERFEATITECVTGKYEYYYTVGGQKVLDKFNTATNADGSASVVSFKKYDDLSITAEAYFDKMDYNDNNVITIKFSDDRLSAEEIATAYVDGTKLGLGKLPINTELLEGTISVKDTVSTGVKTLPVEVTDVYGNIYTCEVEVEVVERSADSFDWDEAVIYMTVTDRFFDGNTNNNDGINKDGALNYHGGDFAGLEAKLDYLKELGVNTIWITPIVENADTDTDNGYHGYWASDFTKLNSHLGTEEELTSLIDALHDRDMKLMVDVVINHAGYGTEDYFNGIIDGKDMVRDASTTISGDDIFDSLSGLPDFVTEDADVRAQLVEWQTDWMDKFDIDYYRVDTVKHVDSTTWAMFKNELTKINPDFKLIGEYYGASYSSNGDYLGTGTMDALLDFDINDKANEFVTGGLESAESFFDARNDALNNTATMGGFLSSHDENSFVDKLMDAGYSEEDALDLAKVAASLQLTAKGQAVIYYGEEIGQHGKEDYPAQTNRKDFNWAEAEAQATEEDSMLAHYSKILEIREAYSKVFAKGDRTTIAVSNKDGYDIFTRTYEDETLYVGLNIRNAGVKVSFSVAEEPGTQMQDLYSGKIYTVSDSGEVTMKLPTAKDGGTVVLVALDKEDNIEQGTEPKPNFDKTEVEVPVDNNNNNQESFNPSEVPSNPNGEDADTPEDTDKEDGAPGTGDNALPIIPIVVLVAGMGLVVLTMKKNKNAI